jgi:lysozyme
MKKTPRFEQTRTIRAGDEAYRLIRLWEGFRASPYQCSAGVWTIGIGTTRYADGSPVTERSPDVTEAQALLLLKDYVQKQIEPELSELVGDLVNRNQYDALVSFIYNIGMGAFKKSTMLRCIQARMLPEAAVEFLRWNRAGGKVLAGLIARRKDEKALFEKDPNLD